MQVKLSKRPRRKPSVFLIAWLALLAWVGVIAIRGHQIAHP